ncbi:MAG: glycoside hydrolase family 3 C-terminal domain-containing protein [Salinibacter sp.]
MFDPCALLALSSLLSAGLLCARARGQDAPDAGGDDLEARAAALVDEMTLEEKAAYASGRAFWTTEPVERLDIPSIWLADGPHGLRRTSSPGDMGMGGSRPATCFPTAAGLASSWDPDLVRRVGAALGREAQAQDVQVLLGPGANIKRSPLGGRNFEYFSEDPLLSGRMAAAHIQGVQSEGVGASLKHYVANNQEYHRMSTSVEVDERTLREIYLRAFEIPVRAADPWTVMVAYNRVNGTFATEHDTLLHVLDAEWGHEGLAISDWGAVQDRVAAAQAGLNLEMPGNDGHDQQLGAAVTSGELDEDTLDRRVQETVELALRGDRRHRPDAEFDEALRNEHHDLAREAAAESVVLLKNEDDFLPLDASADREIAVIGAFAQTPRYQGGGSSRVNPTQVTSAYEALADALGEDRLTYSPGYPLGDDGPDAESLRSAAVETARAADVALVFAGLPPAAETEGADRTRLRMPEAHNGLIEAVADAAPSTGVVLSNGSAVAMPWRDAPRAILETWLAGQAGGAATADVLLGRTNPSGKLATTFPKTLADTPAFLNFPGEDREVVYGERVFVGYRYYDEAEVEPLYPFGYGQSYTTFEVRNLTLDADTAQSSEGVTAQVEVANTGDRRGQEVVQLYLHDPESRLRRPPQALRDFQKVTLDPGASKTVRFALEAQDFAAWDDRRGRWIVESGPYEVRVGTSSRDLPLRQTVTIEGPPADQGPVLDRQSTIRQWLRDPQGREVLEPLLTEMTTAMGDEGGGQPGMEEIFGSLPLSTLSSLSGGALTEAVIEGLVDQVRAAKQASTPEERDRQSE